jgi:DNA polymerase-3 subunit delta
VTDKRKINKLLKEHAKVISLDALDIHGFKKWMLAELKSQGLLIDRVAEEAILGYYRGNMLVMETQIEKLITYVGDAKHIRLADVKLQMSTLDEVGIFELIEYLTLKQKDKFLYKLHAIMQTGTSSQEIVGVLLWHFKRLWAVRDLQDKGLSSGCISSKLNLKEWVYKKVIPQVKRLHQRDFIKIFDGLYHLDINLKNKRIQGTLLLQEFAFYLSA